MLFGDLETRFKKGENRAKQDTPPPIDRQVIFYITLGFSLVLNSVHVYKSRSSIREIIPNAHFEKNQFFTKMKVVVDF